MHFILSFFIQAFVRVALFVFLLFSFAFLFLCGWSIFITIDFIKFLKSVLGNDARLIFIINCLCFNGLPIIIFMGIFHNFSCFFFIDLVNTLKNSSFINIRALWASLRVRGSLTHSDSRANIIILNLRNHSREDRDGIFKTIIASDVSHSLGINDGFCRFLAWVSRGNTCRWVF